MDPMDENFLDFRVVLENVPAALFRGFADGSVELCDRKAEAMTGYTKEEFDSRKVKWTDLIHMEDRGQFKHTLTKALKSDKTFTREYRILSKEGRIAWVHERSQVLCDADGRIESVIGLFFDITETKALEENLRKAERDFRIVVDNIPAVTFKGYPGGTMDFFDKKIETLTGYSPEAFGPKGILWTGLIHEDDRGSARSAFIRALKTDHNYVREYRLTAAGGRTIWIHERSCIVCDQAGRIEYVSGLIFDITERKQLEATVAERTAELQQANERLLLWGKELEHRNTEINLLGQMSDLLQCCHTTEEAHTGFQTFGRQLFPDDSGALFVFGESPATLEAAAIWGKDAPQEQIISPADCWAIRRGRVHGRAEVESGLRCRHVPEGQKAYVCIPMMAHGASMGMLHLQLSSQETERWDARQHLGVEVAEHLGLALAKLKLQEALQQQSVRDPLTGLFNRRYLEESLAREVQKAQRQSHGLGVLMVDLDHFKLVNDRHGHEAGDLVLREMGKIFGRQIRAGDIVCRFGGEEFTILLPEASSEIAWKRAEQIREAARKSQVRLGDSVLEPVTLSIGVALFPQDGTSTEELLQAADSALYRAKKEGRDRVCLAHE
jgi:diguanylate cyclase (GGDEF)-like protein/PAS domain S-box-containing protein